MGVFLGSYFPDVLFVFLVRKDFLDHHMGCMNRAREPDHNFGGEP